MHREEPARVVAVERGKTTLELDRKPGCGACPLCTDTGRGGMRLELDVTGFRGKNGEALKPGQNVILTIDSRASLRSVCLLFGLPLAGLIAGVVVGQLSPISGMARDASSALLGVVLLAGGFLSTMLYDRKVAAKKPPQPTIQRIESE